MREGQDSGSGGAVGGPLGQVHPFGSWLRASAVCPGTPPPLQQGLAVTHTKPFPATAALKSSWGFPGCMHLTPHFADNPRRAGDRQAAFAPGP